MIYGKILISCLALGALSLASCSVLSLSSDEITLSSDYKDDNGSNSQEPENSSEEDIADAAVVTVIIPLATTTSTTAGETTSTTAAEPAPRTTIENIESEPSVILLLPAICEQEPTSYGRQYGTPQYDNSLLDCKGSFNYDDTISYAYIECDYNFPIPNDNVSNNVTKYHNINENNFDSSYDYNSSRTIYSWRIFFRVDFLPSKNPACRLYGRE